MAAMVRARGFGGEFGCDLDAVDATVDQLTQVADELANFASRDDSYAAALASDRIQNALNDFHNDSSDRRGKLEESVTAITEMLRALATGVREIDTAFAEALPEAQQVAMDVTAPGQGSGSAPSTSASPADPASGAGVGS